MKKINEKFSELQDEKKIIDGIASKTELWAVLDKTCSTRQCYIGERGESFADTNDFLVTYKEAERLCGELKSKHGDIFEVVQLASLYMNKKTKEIGTYKKLTEYYSDEDLIECVGSD